MKIIFSVRHLISIIVLLLIIHSASGALPKTDQIPYGSESPVDSQTTPIWPVRFQPDDDCFADFRSLASLSIPLCLTNGHPEVLSFERSPQHDHIWLVKYFSGCAGTTTYVDFYRAVIIDMSRSQILGDEIYKENIYEQETKNDEIIEKRYSLLPTWQWGKKNLVITDEDNQRVVIKIPPAAPAWRR